MASPDLKSIFKNVGKVKPTERGNPLTPITIKEPDGSTKTLPATYDLEVVSCTFLRTRKNDDAFIVKFRVLSSSNPDIKVGAEHTWFQKVMDDTGLGAVQQFMLAVAGLDGSDKAAVNAALEEMAEAIDSACSEEQACAGLKISCRVSQIITKEKKVAFNLHQYSVYRSN